MFEGVKITKRTGLWDYGITGSGGKYWLKSIGGKVLAGKYWSESIGVKVLAGKYWGESIGGKVLVDEYGGKYWKGKYLAIGLGDWFGDEYILLNILNYFGGGAGDYYIVGDVFGDDGSCGYD